MFYKARFLAPLNFAICGNLAPDHSNAFVLLQFDWINKLYKRCAVVRWCLLRAKVTNYSILVVLRLLITFDDTHKGKDITLLCVYDVTIEQR